MEHTKAQITATGGQYFAFYGDMGNPEDAEAFVTKSVQTFGIPEIFVNNAGISHIGLLQDMTPQQWDDLLHTNLSSVFYTSRIIIPYFLQEKHGRIINISSVWGNVGASTEAAYSASKGGVNALTKALAKELNIPVIVLAQLNREAEKRAGKEAGVPRVSDLRDSGSIEQDADQILLLYRPYVMDKNADPAEAKIIVGKNRFGEIGYIDLKWDAAATTYREV